MDITNTTECLNNFINNYWHYVLEHDLDINITYGRDIYTLNVNGFSRTDEHGVEYMMGELSNFDKEIIVRMLPDFKQFITNWMEN